MRIDVRVSQLRRGDVLVATGETVTDVFRTLDSKKRLVYLKGRKYRSEWNANTTIRVDRADCLDMLIPSGVDNA